MLLKALRSRKIVHTSYRLRQSSESSSERQMFEINKLIQNLKLNTDEANLVFAFFWSDGYLLRDFESDNVHVFEVNFDNVKRLPKYMLNFANHPYPIHIHPNDYYEGIIKVEADSRSGEIFLTKNQV